MIGCGNENFTPDIGNYVNPDKTDGPKELPISNYYETNFIVKDVSGNERIDVNLDLYPSTIKSLSQESKKIILDTKGGQQ